MPNDEEICQVPQRPSSATGTVNIRSVKTLVTEKFPRDSVLRQIITEEPDFMKIDEFLVKVEIYLRLLRRLKVE